MNLWLPTFNLIGIGFKSLFLDANGDRKPTFINVVTYIIIPIAVITLTWIYDIKIGESLISDILTIISIFLAITLGVIFIVPDKLAKRFEGESPQNESEVYSRTRYKNFCKLFIQRLSFVLILCVILIILTILLDFIKGYGMGIVTALVLGIFSLSILTILKLIVDIYIFLNNDLSEINSNR